MRVDGLSDSQMEIEEVDVPTECRVNIKLKVNLLMNHTAVSANGFQNDCSIEIKKKERKEIKRNKKKS